MTLKKPSEKLLLDICTTEGQSKIETSFLNNRIESRNARGVSTFLPNPGTMGEKFYLGIFGTNRKKINQAFKAQTKKNYLGIFKIHNLP